MLKSYPHRILLPSCDGRWSRVSGSAYARTYMLIIFPNSTHQPGPSLMVVSYTSQEM